MGIVQIRGEQKIHLGSQCVCYLKGVVVRAQTLTTHT